MYAGIGGNRKLWGEAHSIVAVERDPDIAQIYQAQFPNDLVLIEDAHQFLLDNHKDFDFVWSSPPCQSHSTMQRAGQNRTPRYPDMKLYEEILYLRHNHQGIWVVENVRPYYTPLLHAEKRGRHLFWCNFYLPEFNAPEFKDFINRQTLDAIDHIQDWLGIKFSQKVYYEGNHCPVQVLRNATHPDVGLIVLEEALRNSPSRVT